MGRSRVEGILAANSGSTRGLTEVVGFVLILGLVVVGVAALLVGGGAILDDNQRAAEVKQAEHAMKQLDSTASWVALGDTGSQQVDLGFTASEGSLTVYPDRGWMSVELVDGSNGTTKTIVNETTLGAIAYAHGRTTIAYQGGGVWRQDGTHTVMLSRPEFHYRNDTLTLPIIRTDGERSPYSEVDLTSDGAPVRRFPDRSRNFTNKVSNQVVEISVHSRYYRGWGRFFEQTTNGIVGYDHANETAHVKFLALPATFQIDNGIIATSGPGDIELLGTGAYIDSYNSSRGEYESTKTADGRVEAAGDVVISGDATIEGDVWSGGYIGIESASGVINGDVYHTDGFQNDGTHTGNITQIEGIHSIQPIDGLVDWKVDTLRQTNDNADTSIIDGATLDIAGSSGELEAGAYYFETMSLEGQTLELDTSGGNITIGVRDWIKLNRSGGSSGNIELRGDGTVQIFVQGNTEVTAQVTGEGSRKVNLHVGKASTVDIPQERSRQLRLYGDRTLRATIAGSNGKESSFDGIIYSPAGEFGSSNIYVKHADVYGAIVSGSVSLGQNGQTHFDRGLTDESFPLAPTASRLNFLYVTEHRVTVSAIGLLLARVPRRRGFHEGSRA